MYSDREGESRNDLGRLLDDLLVPLLYSLQLRIRRFLSCQRRRQRSSQLGPQLDQFRLRFPAPRVPLGDRTSPRFQYLGRSSRSESLVDLIVASAVFFKVLANAVLLFFAQERTRSRSEEDLLELVERLLVELLTAEIVDPIASFELCADRSVTTS